MSYGQTGYAQESYGRASGPRAGFWRRLGAAFLDGLIVGVVDTLLQLGLHGAGTALSILVSAAYYTWFEGGPTGQTPGKKAVGIRVVAFESGGQLGYPRAFVRFVGRYVSAIVVFLGYLWMLWDREKQCWHDKFANDVVVPVSAYPLPYRM
ncbi:MAG TPA: RDD family protein [Solirubrobacteraceae bacterium]|jgi:uncharacterized RDD family membrane protein YckC|nr:RDD family protein [Solirubrobacteraceae bacterium]